MFGSASLIIKGLEGLRRPLYATIRLGYRRGTESGEVMLYRKLLRGRYKRLSGHGVAAYGCRRLVVITYMAMLL